MVFNLSFEQQSCRATFGCGASIWGLIAGARWERILEACLRRHLDGHRWERVVDLWDAFRDVALVEYRHGSAGALALLRE